ncbi:hypothetical protein EXIGLDRAFT_696519 [Exidia glandulosa HHB12029]|uniref:C2H2-type domain-containing protein n=1 Tax=Exidia glandulosa HHB12029 TaxID=1314781 RepID=A0A166A5G8_EXIGL|nr:hypothetical protein EXIGLDRAFT_696519 [Exidia glandulosa HHB12029]
MSYWHSQTPVPPAMPAPAPDLPFATRSDSVWKCGYCVPPFPCIFSRPGDYYWHGSHVHPTIPLQNGEETFRDAASTFLLTHFADFGCGYMNCQRTFLSKAAVVAHWTDDHRDY